MQLVKGSSLSATKQSPRKLQLLDLLLAARLEVGKQVQVAVHSVVLHHCSGLALVASASRL
jgi:hypothetical protein